MGGSLRKYGTGWRLCLHLRRQHRCLQYSCTGTGTAVQYARINSHILGVRLPYLSYPYWLAGCETSVYSTVSNFVSVAVTSSLLSTPVGALSRLSQYRYGPLFPFQERAVTDPADSMAAAVTPLAPPARSYTACTPAQWDAWYCAVQSLDANMDLLSVVVY